MFMASVLLDMYCSIHLLYINVCKILYIPAAVCNGMVISSQTLEKLSFGYTQQFKKKKTRAIGTVRKGYHNESREKISKARKESSLKETFPFIFLDRFPQRNN